MKFEIIKQPENLHKQDEIKKFRVLAMSAITNADLKANSSVIGNALYLYKQQRS